MAQPSKYSWPTWKWPESIWWWAVVAVFATIVFWLFPDKKTLSKVHQFELGILILLSPFVFVVLRYAGRLLASASGRVVSFGNLYQLWESSSSQLRKTEALCAEFLRERQSRRAFRIQHTFIQGDAAYIAIVPKQGIRLSTGQRLYVVGVDGNFRGTFEVIDDDNPTRHAKSMGDMDALWLGWARQAGAARSDPPVGSTALLLTADGDDNE